MFSCFWQPLRLVWVAEHWFWKLNTGRVIEHCIMLSRCLNIALSITHCHQPAEHCRLYHQTLHDILPSIAFSITANITNIATETDLLNVVWQSKTCQTAYYSIMFCCWLRIAKCQSENALYKYAANHQLDPPATAINDIILTISCSRHCYKHCHSDCHQHFNHLVIQRNHLHSAGFNVPLTCLLITSGHFLVA